LTLSVMIVPSLPPAEVNGVRYLKVPIALTEDARG
jgi:hypothetical protein